MNVLSATPAEPKIWARGIAAPICLASSGAPDSVSALISTQLAPLWATLVASAA